MAAVNPNPRLSRMTVPLGVANKGKQIKYYYDSNGEQVGMDVDDVTVTTGTTLDAVETPPGDTKFWYDDNQNRVKMVTTAGHVYHFVYDPTASIPAVVYEESQTPFEGSLIRVQAARQGGKYAGRSPL